MTHHLPLCLTLVVGGILTVLFYAWLVRAVMKLPKPAEKEAP